jgi:TfoX/Sxy family transcriptional regulator of competence genes
LDPAVEVKPMFGNLGAFVHGNMFMGLFGSDLGIKLAPADAAEFRRIEGVGPFGPAERRMGGYLTLPPSFTAAESSRWIARSLTHVGAMPPKK